MQCSPKLLTFCTYSHQREAEACAKGIKYWRKHIVESALKCIKATGESEILGNLKARSYHIWKIQSLANCMENTILSYDSANFGYVPFSIRHAYDSPENADSAKVYQSWMNDLSEMRRDETMNSADIHRLGVLEREVMLGAVMSSNALLRGDAEEIESDTVVSDFVTISNQVLCESISSIPLVYGDTFSVCPEDREAEACAKGIEWWCKHIVESSIPLVYGDTFSVYPEDREAEACAKGIEWWCKHIVESSNKCIKAVNSRDTREFCEFRIMSTALWMKRDILTHDSADYGRVHFSIRQSYDLIDDDIYKPWMDDIVKMREDKSLNSADTHRLGILEREVMLSAVRCSELVASGKTSVYELVAKEMSDEFGEMVADKLKHVRDVQYLCRGIGADVPLLSIHPDTTFQKIGVNAEYGYIGNGGTTDDLDTEAWRKFMASSSGKCIKASNIIREEILRLGCVIRIHCLATEFFSCVNSTYESDDDFRTDIDSITGNRFTISETYESETRSDLRKVYDHWLSDIIEIRDTYISQADNERLDVLERKVMLACIKDSE